MSQGSRSKVARGEVKGRKGQGQRSRSWFKVKGHRINVKFVGGAFYPIDFAGVGHAGVFIYMS